MCLYTAHVVRVAWLSTSETTCEIDSLTEKERPTDHSMKCTSYRSAVYRASSHVALNHHPVPCVLYTLYMFREFVSSSFIHYPVTVLVISRWLLLCPEKGLWFPEYRLHVINVFYCVSNLSVIISVKHFMLYSFVPFVPFYHTYLMKTAL